MLKITSKVLLFILFTYIGVFSLEPLQVVSVSPLPESEYVNVNSNIEVVFNREMFPDDINKFTFTLNDGYTDVEGTVEYYRLLKKAVFIPKEKLTTGRNYKASIWAGIRGLDGTRLPSSVHWIFSTGKAVDKTRPFLAASNPSDLERNVPLDQIFRLTFSERILPKSYDAIRIFSEDGTELSRDIYEDENYNVVIVKPASRLQPESWYTIKINKELTDIAGNNSAFEYIVKFFSADVTRPEISKTNPEADSKEHNIASSIKVYMNDDINPETVTRETVKLLLDGEEQVIVPRYVAEDRMIEIIPDSYLQDSTYYEVKLLKGLIDKGGNSIETTSFDFRTQDLTKPKLVEVVPHDKAENIPIETKIKLKFSEIIDKESAEKGIILTDGDKLIPCDILINEYGVNVELIPEKPLTKKTKYRVAASPIVKDVVGNPLDKTYAYGFTTIVYDTQEIIAQLDDYSEFEEKRTLSKIQDMIGRDFYENYLTQEQVAEKKIRDNIPPRIIDNFPDTGMEEIPLNTDITLVFSEEMDENTLESGIILTDGDNEIMYELKYDNRFKKAKISPYNKLEAGKWYRIIANDKVKDLSGNNLLARDFRFRTTFDSEKILITSKLPEPEPKIDPELLVEDIVEIKDETLEDFREPEAEEEDLSLKREKWAYDIVLNLRKKFAQRYAIVTSNPKVKPTRYELALIVRSIINKVNENKLRKLFRSAHGIKDLIQLFQAAVEFENELTLLGVNFHKFEEKLKNNKIPTKNIRDDLNKGIIREVTG